MIKPSLWHTEDKNSTRPLVILRAIKKVQVILPKALVPQERNTRGSLITYYSLMFIIAYIFKGQVHVFAGQVKILSHKSCSTIMKYFCPLAYMPSKLRSAWQSI